MHKQTEQLPELEYGQAELTTYLPGQETPFVVTGDAEVIQDIYKEVQAREARENRQQVVRRGKAVVEASAQVIDPIKSVIGRVGLDLQTVAYDKIHRTSMYDMLRQRRSDERNLRMATKLGLITSTRCQKHERALAAVRGMK